MRTCTEVETGNREETLVTCTVAWCGDLFFFGIEEILNVALDLVSAHRALSEVNWGPHGPE